MSEEKKDMENDLHNANAYANKTLQEIQSSKIDISKLKQAFHNRMCIFGSKTPQVLDEIERRKHEFKHMPIGPIGSYIKVKDPKWCLAIENSISLSLLLGFCCDNVEDSEKLRSILQKHYQNRIPCIIVNRFLPKVHQFSRIANCNYPTVLDKLSISSHIVTNCLIDQRMIESKILIENSMDATNYMLDYDRNAARMQKANMMMISTAYTLDCTELHIRPYRCYPSARAKRPSILEDLKEDAVSVNEQNLSQLESNYEEICSKKSEILRKLNGYGPLFREVDKNLTLYTVKMTEFERQIDELKKVKEVEDVYYLQNELQQMQTEKKKKNEEMISKENELSIHKRSNDELNKEKKEIMSLLLDARKEFNNLSVSMNNTAVEKENLTTRVRQQEANIRKLEKDHQEFKESISSTKKLLEKLLQSATSRCKRIHPQDTSSVIKKKLEDTEKFIQEKKKNNSEDFSEIYLKKEQKLKEAKVELKKLEEYIVIVQNMKEKRKKQFHGITNATKYDLNHSFSSVLSAMHFCGKLSFNDENGTLDMNISNSGKKKVNYCTLSGGERNYVTISFLLALWNRSSMPFRILDEYDVFMDSKNRAVTLKLLVREAQGIKNIQFIFVTPQGLPKMKNANIKVHEITPPKRKNT